MYGPTRSGIPMQRFFCLKDGFEMVPSVFYFNKSTTRHETSF